MPVKILHHNDLDGCVSGTLIRMHYRNAECYSVNYDNPELLPKQESFNKGDIVFLVDYTIADVDFMNWLKENTNLYWIDHHATSLEKQEKNHWEDIKGVRKVGLCGAELCWKIACKGMNMPEFIKLVGDYDTFRHSADDKNYHENTVIPFSFGAMSKMDSMKPERFFEDDFLFKKRSDFYNNEIVAEMIEDGRVIMNYQKVQGKIENPCNAFVRELWGLRFLCMNSCSRGSTQFTIPGTWNPEEHDAMLIYYFNGKKWAYGLYTEKPEINVGAIALEHGGGGHHGAAGFCTDELIEELS